MINTTEFLIKNKETVKNGSKIFSGFKITGIGEKCLKLTNVNNNNDEFISWSEFASNDDQYSVLHEIKEHYQPMVNAENEKEINKALSFVKENEERIKCLNKAATGDKSYKESVEFEELMRQELCNNAAISKLGRAVVKALKNDKEEGEEVEASPKTSSTPETKKSETPEKEITKKEKINIENYISKIIGEDVHIVLGNFPGTRNPDHTINVKGIDFNIYDTGACVIYAYPQNLEFFEEKNEYKIRIKDNQKGGEKMNEKEVYVKYNTKNGKIESGNTIYGTTSTIDYDSITGDFEPCDTGITVKVKEISRDFSEYNSNKCRTGGQYGYYKWKVVEVLE